MSREWHDIGDDPDEHGGKRPFRPEESRPVLADFGGWSIADYITVGLLLLLLAAVTLVLVAVMVGGVYCPPCEEVTAQTS